MRALNGLLDWIDAPRKPWRFYLVCFFLCAVISVSILCFFCAFFGGIPHFEPGATIEMPPDGHPAYYRDSP